MYTGTYRDMCVRTLWWCPDGRLLTRGRPIKRSTVWAKHIIFLFFLYIYNVDRHLIYVQRPSCASSRLLGLFSSASSATQQPFFLVDFDRSADQFFLPSQQRKLYYHYYCSYILTTTLLTTSTSTTITYYQCFHYYSL